MAKATTTLACKLGFEGIISKRLGFPLSPAARGTGSRRKNPAVPTVKREA
jgi:hypothetical protein